jgi:hypothetical protein
MLTLARLIRVYVATGPLIGRKQNGFGGLIFEFEGASSMGSGGVFFRSKKHLETFFGLFLPTIHFYHCDAALPKFLGKRQISALENAASNPRLTAGSAYRLVQPCQRTD